MYLRRGKDIGYRKVVAVPATLGRLCEPRVKSDSCVTSLDFMRLPDKTVRAGVGSPSVNEGSLSNHDPRSSALPSLREGF